MESPLAQSERHYPPQHHTHIMRSAVLHVVADTPLAHATNPYKFLVETFEQPFGKRPNVPSGAIALPPRGVLAVLVDESCPNLDAVMARVQTTIAEEREQREQDVRQALERIATVLDDEIRLAATFQYKNEELLDEEMVQGFRAAMAWIVGSEVHLFTTGGGKARVFAPGMNIVEESSTQDSSASSSGLAGAVQALQRAVEKKTVVNTTPTMELLHTGVLEWRYDVEPLYTKSRIALLLTDIRMPQEVDDMMHKAEHVKGRTAACYAVREVVQFYSHVPHGAVAIIDVLPADQDEPNDDVVPPPPRHVAMQSIPTHQASSSVEASAALGRLASGSVAASKGGLFNGAGRGVVALLLLALVGYGVWKFTNRSKKNSADADSVAEQVLKDPIGALQQAVTSVVEDTASVQQVLIRDANPVEVVLRKAPASSSAPVVEEVVTTIATFYPVEKINSPLLFAPTTPPQAVEKRVVVDVKPMSKGATTATMSWKPDSLTPDRKKRQYALAFEKPVKTGSFTFTYKDRTSSKTLATTNLTVLPSIFPEKTVKQLQNLKLTYGKRLALQTRLVPEAEPMKPKLTVRYALLDANGNPQQTFTMPYTERFQGLAIPASAQQVRVSVEMTAASGAGAANAVSAVPMVAFTRDITPVQQAPDITLQNPVVERLVDSAEAAQKPKKAAQSRKPVQPQNVRLVIKGITVEYDVPVDAVIKDATSAKVINATAEDVEPVGEAQIDYDNADAMLKIYDGDGADPNSTWQLSPENIVVLSGAYSNGTFPMTIVVKNLPTKPASEERTLRGTLAVKASARIKNPKTGKLSATTAETLLVPVNITYR